MHFNDPLYPGNMPDGVKRISYTNYYAEYTETNYYGWRLEDLPNTAVHIEVHEMAFNWRILIADTNGNPVLGIYWCYGKNEYTALQVINEAKRWGATTEEPIGWIKSWTGELRCYKNNEVPDLIPVSPPCFVKPSDSPKPSPEEAPPRPETEHA